MTYALELSNSGDPDGDGQRFTFNLRFPGQYFDAETGLYYNFFRDYDPSTGRYIESDPIGINGGLNTYGYARGNPVNIIDPYGLMRVYAFPTRAGVSDPDMRYEFEFNPPNPVEKILKKTLPKIGKKLDRLGMILGWTLYPYPSKPSPENFQCSLLDKELLDEYIDEFGEGPGPMNRQNRDEVLKWVNKMWSRYPEMKNYYSSPNEILDQADAGAKKHKYNEIYK